jgi:molybdopterin converting factor small subunit
MLSNQYGQAFANEILQDDGKVRLGIGIAVNGAAIGQLAGLSTRLKVGDTIALLPLFLGGG